VLLYRVGLQVGKNLPSVAFPLSSGLKEEVSGYSQLNNNSNNNNNNNNNLLSIPEIHQSGYRTCH